MAPRLSYPEAVAYVARLQGRGWRMGLDRMRAFADELGLPGALGDGAAPRFLHVAGTNGKGTVAAFAQSLFWAAGFRSGGYFSPYVYEIRERIQADGQPISEAEFADLVARLAPIAESFDRTPYGPITEFEFKTAMGFSYWKDQSSDWVACEVGMGGRLDATNILQPACAAIVSIGLDHTQYLGETLAEIATEKAGIVKGRHPVVMGRLDPEAAEVVERQSQRLECPVLALDRDFRVIRRGSEVEFVLPSRNEVLDGKAFEGPMRAENAAIAWASVEACGISVTTEGAQRAFVETWLPGRLEARTWDGVPIVLDGAHNGEAAEALASYLLRAWPDRKWVLATNMLQGHEPDRFFSSFAPLSDLAHEAPIGFHRARKPGEIARWLRGVGWSAEVHGTVEEALRASAADVRQGRADAILITGSFYLVGEAGRLLSRWGALPRAEVAEGLPDQERSGGSINC